MDQEQFNKLESKVDSLHDKLDKYHTQTVKNTTDIAWLKRAVIGVCGFAVTGLVGVAQKFFGAS
jgi:hypothetical protein